MKVRVFDDIYVYFIWKRNFTLDLDDIAEKILSPPHLRTVTVGNKFMSSKKKKKV